MKKTKLNERIENARNIFFDDEFFEANDVLICREREDFLQNRESKKNHPKISTLEAVLKQIFLFFPGTLVLYVLSLVFAIGLINLSRVSSRMILQFNDFVGLISVFLAAILMTLLGLGDVRKPKHFVIPASIILVGVFFGAIAAILSEHFSRSIFINGYPFYFLPLALIVPFLAKDWADKNL